MQSNVIDLSTSSECTICGVLHLEFNYVLMYMYFQVLIPVNLNNPQLCARLASSLEIIGKRQ